jgi:hypothetical protein
MRSLNRHGAAKGWLLAPVAVLPVAGLLLLHRGSQGGPAPARVYPKRPASQVSIAPTARIVEEDRALIAPPQDKLVSSERFRLGPDLWAIEQREAPDWADFTRDATIRKNGRAVEHISGEDLGGHVILARRVHFPTPYVVIAVRGHSACGHGQVTRFYSIRKGRLARMGIDIEHECGGPVFRDFDGDGTCEWVFDDDDWYTYYGRGPRYFLVYKPTRAGGLKLWRRLPNRRRERLPDPLDPDPVR